MMGRKTTGWAGAVMSNQMRMGGRSRGGLPANVVAEGTVPPPGITARGRRPPRASGLDRDAAGGHGHEQQRLGAGGEELVDRLARPLPEPVVVENHHAAPGGAGVGGVELVARGGG